MPLSDGQVLRCNADIIEKDVPQLLGPVVMKELILVIDCSKEKVKINDYNWSLPIEYRHGHAFIPLTTTIFFTRSESTRLHLHFPSHCG